LKLWKKHFLKRSFFFSIFVKSVRKRRESVQIWRERQKGEVQIARFDRVQKNFEKSAKSRWNWLKIVFTFGIELTNTWQKFEIDNSTKSYLFLKKCDFGWKLNFFSSQKLTGNLMFCHKFEEKNGFLMTSATFFEKKLFENLKNSSRKWPNSSVDRAKQQSVVLFVDGLYFFNDQIIPLQRYKFKTYSMTVKKIFSFFRRVSNEFCEFYENPLKIKLFRFL
jgi:hypothetical protein